MLLTREVRGAVVEPDHHFSNDIPCVAGPTVWTHLEPGSSEILPTAGAGNTSGRPKLMF